MHIFMPLHTCEGIVSNAVFTCHIDLTGASLVNIMQQINN
jgi:hypothetical protein